MIRQLTRFMGDLVHSTLKRSREFVQANKRKGCICPTCDQPVHEDHAILDKNMAYALCVIWNLFGDDGEWHQIPEMVKEYAVFDSKILSVMQNRKYANLVFWGLLESKGDYKEDGVTKSGMYRITKLGVGFVLGRVKVPKYMYRFNGVTTEDNASVLITLREALKNNWYEGILTRV